MVLQYNKRDLADPYVIEELHRRLDVPGAAVFEAVATETTGVLQTLSTLAKHVIRKLRSQTFEVGRSASDGPELRKANPEQVGDAAPEASLGSEPTPSSRMEDAILAEDEHSDTSAIDELAREAEEAFDAPWGDVAVELEPADGAQIDAEFSIASVGEATRSGDRGVRVPLVVADKQGRRSKLVLTIQLDPLQTEDPD
jgi:hypothetical protein